VPHRSREVALEYLSAAAPAAAARREPPPVVGAARSNVGGGELEGVLEELDGTPIRPTRGLAGAPGAPLPADRHAVSWWRAAVAASTLALGRPSLWPYALVAFLARGGLLLLAGPIVVTPTLIGLSNLVGPASVTAGGPGPRLVALVAVGVIGALVLAVVGTLVAAAAEAAFHRSSAEPRPGSAPRRPGGLAVPAATTGQRATTARIAAIRLVLIVPVIVAAVVALPAWLAVAYRELTLPADVGVPLLVRVVAGAPLATALVALAWLGCEVVGGFAARRSAFLGTPWPRALAAALVDPLRAPGGTLLTVAASLGLGAATLAPSLAVLAAAWEAARRPLIDEGLSPAAVAGTILLVATWAAVLGLAGAAAAWRAMLGSAELLRRGPAGMPDHVAVAAPEPPEPARHE
jgi:hypothetical protein